MLHCVTCTSHFTKVPGDPRGQHVFPGHSGPTGPIGPIGRPLPGTKVGSLKLSGSQRDVVERKALLVTWGVVRSPQPERAHRLTDDCRLVG